MSLPPVYSRDVVMLNDVMLRRSALTDITLGAGCIVHMYILYFTLVITKCSSLYPQTLNMHCVYDSVEKANQQLPHGTQEEK